MIAAPPRPCDSSADITRRSAVGIQKVSLRAIHSTPGEEAGAAIGNTLTRALHCVALVSLIKAQACWQTESVPEVPHVFPSCLDVLPYM